jgi:hypothetical protein
MIEIIIAHLLGDWVFQSRKMAVEKGKQTLKGYLYCLFHVILYTAVFYFIVPNKSMLFYLSIMIPHFLIDKWSLVSYWQRFRDGKFWWESYKENPTIFTERVEMGFAGLRYAVEDNTIHLICLYLSFVFFS